MKKNNKNTVKAVNKNVRSSPRKVNNLLKNIRGKKADIAIRDLSFARQRIAFEIKKTLQSAIANAENNNQYDIDNLYIKEAYVGKSIVLKRFRPRAKGRASAIKKPYSNLTIILSENIKQKREFRSGFLPFLQIFVLKLISWFGLSYLQIMVLAQIQPPRR